MQEIAELRRLLAAATPGPWHQQSVEEWWKAPPRHYQFDLAIEDGSGIGELAFERDATFIVAVVNALPALLDAAEALDGLLAAIDDWDLPEGPFGAQHWPSIVAARSALEKLR